MGQSYGFIGKKLDRRTFLKSSLVAVGTAGFLPVLSSCAQPRGQAMVFTGGTILTVDSTFSQVDAIAILGNKILAVGTDAG